MAKSQNTNTANAPANSFNALEQIEFIAYAKVDTDKAEVSLYIAKERISAAITELIVHNVKIGDLRKCAVAQYFRDIMKTQVNFRTGKPYTVESIANMLSDIRYALETGKELVWNHKRAEKKTNAVKGTSTKKSVNPDDTKAGKVESVKSTREKLLVQLENCVSILQGSEDADFDVVSITAKVNALITELS